MWIELECNNSMGRRTSAMQAGDGVLILIEKLHNRGIEIDTQFIPNSFLVKNSEGKHEIRTNRA